MINWYLQLTWSDPGPVGMWYFYVCLDDHFIFIPKTHWREKVWARHLNSSLLTKCIWNNFKTFKSRNGDSLPALNDYVTCKAVSTASFGEYAYHIIPKRLIIIHLSFCTSQIWWTKISWISSRSGNTGRCISCYHPTCWWMTPLLLTSLTVSILPGGLSAHVWPLSVSNTTLRLGHLVEAQHELKC